MYSGIYQYRNISENHRQSAREFGIGIIGNSKGIFGQALLVGLAGVRHALHRRILGTAVQVEPMKFVWKAPGTMRLNLHYDWP